ncbi:hypothetical protein [Haloarcula salinisoli]|uniref:Uncharacterized protein n=1 Tax=Haloarcula salinisoli TaxID=2487746 RepID=A0A8J7YMI8_9EURY|nr:hypothetical protein [Halomicroarcula salinisoli]MBX0304506.1 hypothetical protein [Halomicroarcula salinisoli]
MDAWTPTSGPVSPSPTPAGITPPRRRHPHRPGDMLPIHPTGPNVGEHEPIDIGARGEGTSEEVADRLQQLGYMEISQYSSTSSPSTVWKSLSLVTTGSL